jgi:TolB protein
VQLEISRRDIERMNIAITAFLPVDAHEKRVSAVLPESIVENDLLLSDRFTILRTSMYSESLFSANNIPVYIGGTYEYRGDELFLTCGLFDARSRDPIEEKKYSGGENRIRPRMHHFSDAVVLALFGEQGVAQTKIVYVNKTARGKQICVMDYDGHNQEQVTNNGSINILPCWSGNNGKIAYVSYVNNRTEIFIAD